LRFAHLLSLTRLTINLRASPRPWQYNLIVFAPRWGPDEGASGCFGVSLGAFGNLKLASVTQSLCESRRNPGPNLGACGLLAGFNLVAPRVRHVTMIV
jgi:hypothetical protein